MVTRTAGKHQAEHLSKLTPGAHPSDIGLFRAVVDAAQHSPTPWVEWPGRPLPDAADSTPTPTDGSA